MSKIKSQSIPKDALVFEIIYRDKRLPHRQVMHELIGEFFGVKPDLSKGCSSCYRLSRRFYYLYQRLPDGKVKRFQLAGCDYATAFCKDCLDDTGILLSKLWDCKVCKVQYKRTNIFVCKTCNEGEKLINRLRQTIETYGVRNKKYFVACMDKIMESIDDEITGNSAIIDKRKMMKSVVDIKSPEESVKGDIIIDDNNRLPDDEELNSVSGHINESKNQRQIKKGKTRGVPKGRKHRVPISETKGTIII